jgi:lipopolysaccharide biosynthesis regulator YciM
MKKLLSLFLFISICTTPVFAQDTEIEKIVAGGIQFHDKQQYKEAIDVYKKALALDENSALTHYELATTYFAMKDYGKAIEHSEKVIKLNKKHLEAAYVLKGSAEDITGKTKDAVKTYKAAIKKYPGSYLLHYNLALTSYNTKEFEQAENSLQSALQENPKHSSSHLLLGYLMADQSKRVKSLLALYNFLLVEPNSQRSADAYKLLHSQLKKGVTKGGDNTINITLSMDSKKDDFGPAEMMISMLEASKNIDENKKKSDQQLFSENTGSLFAVLGELKGKNKSFWWTYYVDFFYSLKKNEHVETFTYYISQPARDTVVDSWLKENNMKIDAFSKWYNEYKRN